MQADIPYQRVLLKISGEALASLDPQQSHHKGISSKMLEKLSQDIKNVVSNGVEVCVVVGAGNIYRGISGEESLKIERGASDYMGMLATIINGVALQHALMNAGVDVKLMSAIPTPTVCESYAPYLAETYMRQKKVVIFAAGTGNPYFTTDTAAVLRGVEMHCNLMLKATKVAGIYDKDPKKNDDATLFSSLSYAYVREKQLKVMDLPAVALAEENNLPFAVFSIYESDGFLDVLRGKGRYTIVKNTKGD